MSTSNRGFVAKSRCAALVAVAAVAAISRAAAVGSRSCWPAAPTSTRRTSGAGDLDTVLRAGTLEYYKEGAAATVSVRRLTGTHVAGDRRQGGRVERRRHADAAAARPAAGAAPRRTREDICVIGLGSGVTLGSALATGDGRRADVVEISPEVVEASHFFDRENGRALAHPASA